MSHTYVGKGKAPSTATGTMSHTPGPWKVVRERRRFNIHDGPLNQGLATCYETGGTLGRAEANARLIAAAPELLEIAKRAIVNLNDWAASEEEREYDITAEGLRSLSRALGEVIAKAEGRP